MKVLPSKALICALIATTLFLNVNVATAATKDTKETVSKSKISQSKAAKTKASASKSKDKVAKAKSKTSNTKSTAKKSATTSNKIVNLNKATLDDLMTLKGIGKTKAQAIIAYRNKGGKFKSVNDLSKVKGIGEKTLNENKARLKL